MVNRKSLVLAISIILLLLLTHPQQNSLIAYAAQNSKAKGPYVDPLIYDQGPGKFLGIIWFKNRAIMGEALKEIESNGIEVVHQYELFPAILVRINKNNVKLLRNLPGVEGVFYNREYYLLRGKTSNGVKTSTLESSQAIGAHVFWQHGYNGSGIKIGIIDTGIDPNHPDFQGKIVAMKSFVKTIYGYEKDEEDPTDGNTGTWHGTRVAGIAAGAGYLDENLGTGVAPGALIIAAKVFPSGERTTATLAGIIAAIEWCVEQGVDVINMSLGAGAFYGDPVGLAVERAVKAGVTVVIAAGNEGDGGTATMSVGAPGLCPYAITVGATDVNGTMIHTLYSSIGPTIYLAVKPDISAPSGVPAPISTESGEYYGDVGFGTSFAAPHVAGAAALIAQYLKEAGVDKKYWPGIIKYVLMETARPIILGETEYYDLWAGAGFVDLANAYNLLEDFSQQFPTPPDKIFVLPTKIPTGLTNKDLFFPYIEKVFQGMRLEFNFTIVPTTNTTVSISFLGNISDVINLHSPTTIEALTPTTLWEFNATFSESAGGYYEGEIVFQTPSDTVRVPISFHLVKPKQRWLFDLRHTSWSVDFKYGQYRRFYGVLEENNICVEHWYFSFPPLTIKTLSRYDLVFIPDAASYYGIYSKEGFLENISTTIFLDSEIEALLEYVNNNGSLFIIGMHPDSNNLTELNRLVENFGVEFLTTPLVPEGETGEAKIVMGHLLSRNVEELPFYGVGLKVRSSSMIIAKYKGKPVLAVYPGEGGGFVLISSTNFILDNWAFENRYPTKRENSVNFVHNIIELVDKQLVLRTSISPSKLSVNEKIRIEVNATVGTIKGFIEDYTGVHEVELTREASNKWTGTPAVKIAGDGAVLVRAYVDGEYWVHRVKFIEVNKVETVPPDVLPEYPDGSTIPYVAGNLTIRIVIKDNYELMYHTKLIRITANVTEYYVKLVDSNKTTIILDLIIPKTILNELLPSSTSSVIVKISVNALDINLNQAQLQISYIIAKQKLQARIPSTIIIAAVVIIVVAVIVALFLRKYSKK